MLVRSPVWAAAEPTRRPAMRCRRALRHAVAKNRFICRLRFEFRGRADAGAEVRPDCAGRDPVPGARKPQGRFGQFSRAGSGLPAGGDMPERERAVQRGVAIGPIADAHGLPPVPRRRHGNDRAAEAHWRWVNSGVCTHSCVSTREGGVMRGHRRRALSTAQCRANTRMPACAGMTTEKRCALKLTPVRRRLIPRP